MICFLVVDPHHTELEHIRALIHAANALDHASTYMLPTLNRTVHQLNYDLKHQCLSLSMLYYTATSTVCQQLFFCPSQFFLQSTNQQGTIFHDAHHKVAKVLIVHPLQHIGSVVVKLVPLTQLQSLLKWFSAVAVDVFKATRVDLLKPTTKALRKAHSRDHNQPHSEQHSELHNTNQSIHPVVPF
jgi:hypothetical protein